MTPVDFTIDFEDADFHSGVVRLDPGSPVRGRLRLEPGEEIRARGVRLRLQWQTSGRGDTDRQVVADIEVAQGSLSVGTDLETKFSFSLPNEPWSYAGHYVNIIWSLDVIVDIPLGRDIRHQERLIVAPKRIG